MKTNGPNTTLATYQDGKILPGWGGAGRWIVAGALLTTGGFLAMRIFDALGAAWRE